MSLLAHYNLDETSGTTAVDSVAAVNGTISGGVTLNQAGSPASPSGKSMLFDGVDDYIDLGQVAATLDALSFSAWIKNPDVTPAQSLISSVQSVAGTKGWSVITQNGLCRFLVYVNGDGDRSVIETSSTVFTGDTWAFITVTKAAGTLSSGMKIYIDGVLAATTITLSASSSTFQTTNPLNLGDWGTVGDIPFQGTIDDVRIYDHELTAQEVSDLFTARVLVDDSATTTSNTLVNIDVLANDANMAVPSPTPLAHYKLDETSGTTAVDSVGSVDGTVTGGVTLNQAGSPYDTAGKSMLFDGVDGKITAPTGNFEYERTDSFSFSVWIKTSTTPSSTTVILGKQAESGNFQGYSLRQTIGTGGLTFLLMGATGNQISINTSGVNIVDNIFHLITVSYNGSSAASGISIYVDGFISTVSIVQDTLSVTLLTSEPLRIGGKVASGNVNGSLDEVRIYNSELTAQQVADLYAYTVPQITISTPPADGTAVLSSDRLSIDYTSDIAFLGTDTFEYDVDASGSPSIVTVTVNTGLILRQLNQRLHTAKPLQIQNNSIIRYSGE